MLLKNATFFYGVDLGRFTYIDDVQLKKQLEVNQLDIISCDFDDESSFFLIIKDTFCDNKNNSYEFNSEKIDLMKNFCCNILKCKWSEPSWQIFFSNI